MPTTSGNKRFAKAAKVTARAQRSIQRRIDRKERRKPSKSGKSAMQAGARPYPVPPLPKQHLKKPGKEADLRLAPMFDAPHYKGRKSWKARSALITGGDSGIGRAVAVLFAREGADVAVAYLSEQKGRRGHEKAVENEGRRCILHLG